MKINSLLQGKPEEFNYLFNIEINQEILNGFSGINYVIMQGSSKRALQFAKKLASKLLKIDPNYFEPKNIIRSSNFVIYKIGNCLSVSHGMGCAAVDSLLHALTKLLYFAGSTDVEYLRVGTSGGLGVEPGTVIITKKTFMPNLEPYYTTYELGKRIDIPTEFDLNLVNKVIAIQPRGLEFLIITGNSIAANDFYLGQCRYDGAMKARKDKEFRAEFFKRAHELEIYNFEMESSAFAAFCNVAKIPATMIAVTLVNRFETDQITATTTELEEFSNRSQSVVLNYLISQMV